VHDLPASAAASVHEWLPLVRGEFLEMPGLSLTARQAERLWGLEPAACHALLSTLVDLKFLRRTPGGAYVLAL
jgi:DNA-binding IclR family transcriptional regulator